MDKKNWEKFLKFNKITFITDRYSRMLQVPNIIIYHSFYGRTTKRCSPILLHDNARPHTSNQTKKCLSELNCEVLPHPPDSPDMTPTDFNLFRSLQHFLADKMFDDIEEVTNGLNDFLRQKIWIFITTACINLSSLGERFLYQMACISLIKTFPFL